MITNEDLLYGQRMQLLDV